ncbi:MAG: hypothetical protein M1816_006529 [Peltula sp. TS41687]|nr:MAG: hypothetical protein M1816_006529 [Peltula sp. TS41687]
MAFRFHAGTWRNLPVFALSFLSLFGASHQTRYIQATDEDGTVSLLDDARKPALFTRNFGDCLGNSVVNVTRFDAAYYKDNMTVLFHLQGNTNIHNESLMMYIGVFAYGEGRFDLTFNPCNANIASLCPMKRGVPIQANGIIPIAQSDVASIPHFEGQAILRIFANSTQSEIGCYSAVVTNGATLSHPKAVGTTLGIFVVLTLGASFITAIYGDHIPTTRKHYAHSLSILVVFAVLHHIYFTGVLSMNWPSVLPAFWSNYAWAGGMIYSSRMQQSINRFLGSNLGNTSMVGAAGSGTPLNNPQLLFALGSIYQKDGPAQHTRSISSLTAENAISKRDLADGFTWYGEPVKPGMPLPGNYSGFPGTLSVEDIPASNAFMTGFLWLLILLLCIAGSITAFKWILEGLRLIKVVKEDRLTFFRRHWLRFTVAAVLRALLTAFFMITFLALFQFSYKGPPGVTALAAVIFLIFLVATFTIAGYACYYRLRFGHYEVRKDRLFLKKKKLWKFIPWYQLLCETNENGKETSQSLIRVPIQWRSIRYVDNDPQRTSVHEDEDYIRKFGWLAARFRRTRWWFFTIWIVYEFVRACFHGGAVGHPMSQVFGLLIVEIIALVIIIRMRPFEGQRLNVLMVYLLGFSKVLTVALSAAFDVRFNLPRITTTVIGVVIVVIHGILTIALLLAIIVGLISSHMSITRNRERFTPESWAPMRERYFRHLDKAASDLPPLPPPMPQKPVEPHFDVSAVRRYPKIEDEDEEFMTEIGHARESRMSVAMPGSIRGSRPNSIGNNSIMSNTMIPFGARVHRASWSTRDFESFSRISSPMQHSNSDHPQGFTAPLHRAAGSVSSIVPPSPTRGASPASFPLHRAVTEEDVISPVV